MKLKVLGIGGAVNDGLPYNSLLVDGRFLLEAPADLMTSLGREGLSPAQIEVLWISHIHGDHVFGLPFLFLARALADDPASFGPQLRVFGPAGCHDWLIRLCVMAFGERNPAVRWCRERLEVTEMTAGTTLSVMNGWEVSVVEMNHDVPTFGFVSVGEPSFAWFPDTLWSSALAEALKRKPRTVFCDLGGDPGEDRPVHLDRKTLREQALPITGEGTAFWGTHVRRPFEDQGLIRCAYPGLEIEL